MGSTVATGGKAAMGRCQSIGIKLRDFILKGNVVDLAVAIVVGTAFTAVVKALVADILTPLIAAIYGGSDFSALTFTIHNSKFLIGDFINNVITFLVVATVIFFVVVLPMQAALAKYYPVKLKTTCPYCAEDINKAATRCRYCCSEINAVPASTTGYSKVPPV